MTSKELILKTCEIPAVPMVAMKILRLVESPSTSVGDLHEAIMADQAIAARVLRMANSAFYGMRREIDTISDAILITGIASIKNLVMAVSTRDVYKSFGLLEQKMWEHSIGASVAAGLIASEIRFLKPEEAVVAGLLHDSGKVLMNISQPEKFLLLTEKVYEEKVTFAQIEEEIFGFGHAEVGGLFAREWEFPELICNAIAGHHTCGARAGKDPYADSLCNIIAFADAMCVRQGIGYREPMEDINDKELKRALGITNVQFNELLRTFKKEYTKEKALYQ